MPHSQLLYLGKLPAFPCFSSHRGDSSPSQVARGTQQLWQWPRFQELLSLVFYSVVRNVRHTRSICGPAFIPRVRFRGQTAPGHSLAFRVPCGRPRAPEGPCHENCSGWRHPCCSACTQPLSGSAPGAARLCLTPWQGEPISKASSHSIPRCWQSSHLFC